MRLFSKLIWRKKRLLANRGPKLRLPSFVLNPFFKIGFHKSMLSLKNRNDEAPKRNLFICTSRQETVSSSPFKLIPEVYLTFVTILAYFWFDLKQSLCFDTINDQFLCNSAILYNFGGSFCSFSVSSQFLICLYIILLSFCSVSV